MVRHIAQTHGRVRASELTSGEVGRLTPNCSDSEKFGAAVAVTDLGVAGRGPGGVRFIESFETVPRRSFNLLRSRDFPCDRHKGRLRRNEIYRRLATALTG